MFTKMVETHLFVKMSDYQFPVPWLKGHPIEAPHKIDMIDWYSQTIGYFAEPTEHDSRNGVLRILRLHGGILYNDEFSAESTINYEDTSTYGRITRVFRSIDMIRKYKAACEDGADLSKSIIRDFGAVWIDEEGNELPRELMQNLRQVTKEIESRSIKNSPILVFWMALRSEAGLSNPQDNVPQAMDQLPNGEAATVNFSPSGPQRSLTALNPATAEFIPNNSFMSPAALSRTLSTGNLSGSGPFNPSGQPITTLDTSITNPGSSGYKAVTFYDTDGEYWTNDEIFIPNFCHNKPPKTVVPQPIKPKLEEPKPDSDAGPSSTSRSGPSFEADKNGDSGDGGDEGCLSSRFDVEENDADDELSSMHDTEGNDTDDRLSESGYGPSEHFYGVPPWQNVNLPWECQCLLPWDSDCELDNSDFPGSCQELDSLPEDRFVPDLNQGTTEKTASRQPDGICQYTFPAEYELPLQGCMGKGIDFSALQELTWRSG